ncbi:MAG: hypothetical protein P8Y80_10310 [Acidobacteriota bacterium]
MNKKDTRIDDLEALIHQTLKDDLPPNVETGMKRQFQDFKRALNRNEELSETEGWFRTRGPFRKEILAIASAAMIILGLVMQLSVSQNALAHSIEKLKVIVSISSSLDYVSSMDCRVMKEDARGEQVFYRIRWRTNGNVRVDMDSSESTETFWIPHETIFLAGPGGGSARSMSINTMTADPVWRCRVAGEPATELMNSVLSALQTGRISRSMQTPKRTFPNFLGSIPMIRH